MNKKIIIIVVILLVLVGLYILRQQGSQVSVKEYCKYNEFGDTEFCEMREIAKDAGKVCADSEECINQCLPTMEAFEAAGIMVENEPTKENKPGAFLGECTEFPLSEHGFCELDDGEILCFR